MAVYNRSSQFIQIASHPHLSVMPRMKGSLRIQDWCFSHLPKSGCFISHYCANQYSKSVMKSLYKLTDEEKRQVNDFYLVIAVMIYPIQRATYIQQLRLPAYRA